MNNLTDTHCHLYGKEYDEDREAVVERACAAGVNRMVQVGTSVEESRQAVALAESHEAMVATVGIHPHEWEKWSELEIKELRKLAQQSKKVRAIGECGLDFGRIANNESGITGELLKAKSKQQELFEAQIALAGELKLPLVIHCRDAHQEKAHILKQAIRHTLSANPPGVMHCFTGTWAEAKQYIDLGFFISFSGIVTFKKNVEAIQEAAKKVPLESMLIETDAPYLAPEPHRGKRNEPAYLPATAEKIAELRGIDVSEVARVTSENAQRLFRFE